jgi:hypothetical protein
LLERVEDFGGVVILATSLRENLDEALMQGSAPAPELDLPALSAEAGVATSIVRFHEFQPVN